MDRIAVVLLCFTGDCLAHTGHGAPLIHAHGWDWVLWTFGILALAAAALAIWRAR